MDKKLITKLVNQGYSMGLSTLVEFTKAIQIKLTELQKKDEKFKYIKRGYELALQERLKERKNQLNQDKGDKGISQER